MPRRINGPQNKEQLQLMVEAVRGEVNLAQDLLNSYEQDLADLEANTTMSEIDKNSRRVFLETAIKESKDLLNLRQRQLKAIDPMKSGKKVGQARRDVWNDATIESKGMNAIMRERANIAKEEKHSQDVEKLQTERQARSEAVRNAATTLDMAADKLAQERQMKKNGSNFVAVTKLPKFIKDSDRWIFVDKSKSGSTYIYADPDNQNVRYIYNPEISEVIKNETVGNKQLNNVFDINTGSWMQFPKEYMDKKNWHYDGVEGKWVEYRLGQDKTQELNLENTEWQVPVYDENGNPVRDQNGNLVFESKTDEEFINGKSDEETAQLARQIKRTILDGEDERKQQEATVDKVVYRKNDVHLSLFQRIKQWFMRLFNKNYQLPEPNKYVYHSNTNVKDDDLINEDLIENNDKTVYTSDKEKRTIKGFYLPKVKQFFKDNKRTIMALSAAVLASIAVAVSINSRKEHNRQIIEEKARQEQIRLEEEKQRELEEQQALQEAKKEEEEQEQDKIINHNEDVLSTGSIQKQYVAPAGLEYTADSTGRGMRGTLSNDTIVELYNRAIIKENEDGTKQILLTSKGKTWEEYANNTGKSIEDIQKLLEQDNTYEAGAIMLGGTNHNILNTYGWVKLSDLKESTRGTENLKDFVITTGNDNTEILQQLQQEQEGTER